MSGIIDTIWELPAEEKFDDFKPFNPFRNKIEDVARQWGLSGYLDGSVMKPTPQIAPATKQATEATTAPTMMYSLNPSLVEWVYRDKKMKSTISMNTVHLRSLVDDVAIRSSAEIWQVLKDTYLQRDEMWRIHADIAFKSLTFNGTSGQTLAGFFNQLKTKCKEAMDYGNKYTDEEP